MSIEICAGSFAYQKGKDVLTDVSLYAGPGEVAAILGPNGVGKTTLLKCMLGFLPWDRGMTRIDGTDIRKIKGKALWRKAAYVPQARENAFAYNTEDMVLLGRSPYLGDFSVPGKEDREAAMEAMEMAGITHLIGKSCARISGGELQMVLIARALAARPDILVLDEPESGLDFRNQIAVLDLIRRLCSEKKLTAVMNTHYPDHALRISDQALVLMGGGMHLYGRTKAILTKEHLRAAFGVEIALQTETIGNREYSSVIPLELLDKNESAFF